MRFAFFSYILFLFACRPEIEHIDESHSFSITPSRFTIPNVPPPPDPYADWEHWCEELVQPNCYGHGSECLPSRTGRERLCFVPRELRDDPANSGKCVPIYLGRTPRQERDAIERRKMRLRQVIEDRCQAPDWWKWGQDQDVPSDCWSPHSCTRRCNPEKLHRFLRVVARREADWRPTKVHNLDQDVESASAAWLRHCAAGTYEGNPHLGQCVQCKENDPFWSSDPKIEVYACRKVHGTPGRWRPSIAKEFDAWKRWRAYGLYAQNAALWMMTWDVKAPPELLCQDVESTEMALRRLRTAWRKLTNGVTCDGKKRFHEPTWANLHSVVWSGTSPCRESLRTRKRIYLENRMRKVKLDPDEVVTLEMLGEPVPIKDQNGWATNLRKRLVPQ